MSQRVIDLLNQARARELTAILQYMAQHYELEDKDFGKLASKVKDVAIVEMGHAEKLAERILFLNGQPSYKPDAEPMKGQDIAGMMRTDIGLESSAVTMYNEAANICAQEKDQISKEVFESLLSNEEDHLNFFQNTLEHVEELGQAYLASLAD